MNIPSASDIVRMWELGQNSPVWYRSLLLLGPGFPEKTERELAALSIGRRNVNLLKIRDSLFGPMINAFVKCPKCSTPLEFQINAADISSEAPPEPPAAEYRVSIEEFELLFRLPNSHDIASLSDIPDNSSARWKLIRQCLLQAKRDHTEFRIEDLPEKIIGALADRMSFYDPGAEIELAFDCPACERQWSSLFDISTFFWSEISVRAQHLLNQVKTLAHAFGWREDDILSMSAVRRQFYINQLRL